MIGIIAHEGKFQNSAGLSGCRAWGGPGRRRLDARPAAARSGAAVVRGVGQLPAVSELEFRLWVWRADLPIDSSEVSVWSQSGRPHLVAFLKLEPSALSLSNVCRSGKRQTWCVSIFPLPP